MKIVDKVSAKMPLSEAGQGEKEVKIALINSKGETLTPFCKCKDYFNDMIWSKKTGNDVSVFGFKWHKDDDKGELDKEFLTMAVKLQARDTKKLIKITKIQIKGVSDLLTRINKALKFKPLGIDICDNDEHLILTYDREWSEYPYLYSAFLLFLRLGFTWDCSDDILAFYSKGGKHFISPHDEGYVRSAKIKIGDILKGKIDKKQKYSMYKTGYDIHGSSGVVGYSGYSI